MATEILFSGLVSSNVSSDSITANLNVNGQTGLLNLSRYTSVAFYVQLKTLTGGSSPTVQVGLQTGDGQTGVNQQWYNLNTPPAAWTSAPSGYKDGAGLGAENAKALGHTGRFNWTITGSPTTCTFFVTVIGKI